MRAISQSLSGIRAFLAKLVFSFLRICGYKVLRLDEGGKPWFIREFSVIQLLRECSGVLHIGAHAGQERENYNSLGLSVIWIEANPETFAKLKENIVDLPNQEAIRALVGETNRHQVKFHLTNNQNASDSIFLLSSENDYPNLANNGSLDLEMVTLDSLFQGDEIRSYNYWVLDVQGSELGVLKGAEKLLNFCDVLECEVSTYPTYIGQPLFPEIESFLAAKGFIPLLRPIGKFHDNIVFLRKKGIRHKNDAWLSTE